MISWSGSVQCLFFCLRLMFASLIRNNFSATTSARGKHGNHTECFQVHILAYVPTPTFPTFWFFQSSDRAQLHNWESTCLRGFEWEANIKEGPWIWAGRVSIKKVESEAWNFETWCILRFWHVWERCAVYSQVDTEYITEHSAKTKHFWNNLKLPDK